ncbi:MAG: transglutaminase domain-containing protein [Deltaproteobacteria bacterium]|nr:transglutaminase domain-containing protein [Deltaproteobacteria bacterium]
MRALVLVVAVGCARPAVPGVGDVPTAPPRDAMRQYTVWLGGARIGTARESETWTASGVTLRRVETLRFLRGDSAVDVATTIEIEANAALVPERVRWTELAGAARTAEATHDARGWHSETLTTGVSLAADAVPADALPAELVPLLVRRDRRFAGDVFLVAQGFIGGPARVEAIAPRRMIARVEIGTTPAEATIDLADDGMPERVVDGEGVIELRATEGVAAAPFAPVDLIAATSIPIRGRRGHALVLDGELALPAVPGQRAVPGAGGMLVELDAALPGDLPPGAPGPDRTRAIAAIVARVRARITPSLAGAPASSRDAHAVAGDCTTFALAYAALATARGIPTRVVTGLRVDRDRLVRHRWAISWTGARWIAVDAAFAAAPAGGDLVGLAVHDADAAGLVSGEAALSSVHAASWARPDAD